MSQWKVNSTALIFILLEEKVYNCIVSSLEIGLNAPFSLTNRKLYCINVLNLILCYGTFTFLVINPQKFELHANISVFEHISLF